MLVTEEIDRRNRRRAFGVAALILPASLLLGLLHPVFLALLLVAPVLFWMARAPYLRRKAAAARPFTAPWQAILENRVRFYRALEPDEKQRFRQMVNVFLDEVRITGVRTEVDDTVRLLVAASAIVPIFGFRDWEYSRLGEVLIYPSSFDADYRTTNSVDENLLGLAGFGHLRGVVILSKPSLLRAFSDLPIEEHVGVHEFAHLVEQEVIEGGLPAEIPNEAMREWVRYVGRELRHPSHRHAWINDYAYTNDREFFAVLSEYFFGSPEALRARDPDLYDLMRKIFHQDPAALFAKLRAPGATWPRNAACPCASGQRFAECCLGERREWISKKGGEVA